MPDNTLTVGNVSITSLSDGLLEFDLCNFFPSVPEDDWQPYRDHLSPEGKVSFNLAAFLIRSDGKNILVDTGLGPKPADAPETPWGELMNDFQAHGIRPEDIDAVVMTHLHRDHVGWNLQSSDGRYVPTFPNARYWLSRADWDACHDPALIESRFPNAPTCVWPLEDLGLIEFMEGECQITGRADHPAFSRPHAGAHEHRHPLPGRVGAGAGRRAAQHRPGPRTGLGVPRRH